MTTVLAPPPVSAPAPAASPGRTPRSSWFVRITIAVVVLLWTIPTLGVLISSFRPAALVNSTGWWTVLAHPFRGAQWTLGNYRSALSTGGFGNAFLNSMAVAIPATVPIQKHRRYSIPANAELAAARTSSASTADPAMPCTTPM